MSGQMDDDLANTIYNLNSMIDTANKTIGQLANEQTSKATLTTVAKNFTDAYECIKPKNIKCDKDKFDEAFFNYVNALDCSGNEYKIDITNSTCDHSKVINKVYTDEGTKLLEDTIEPKLTSMMNELTDLLTVANEQEKYYNHLDDLADKYSEAAEVLGGKVDKTVSRLKTEHRRTFYENQQMDLISYVTKFLTFFYWLSVFAWVIVIIYRTRYMDYTNIGLTAAFVVFPFVADILIVWSFQIIMAIYDALPTDAYLDMRRGS
jgi:hypothetical protein